MSESLAWLYRHNLWANLRLLDCCAGVADDLLEASEPGTYGRARDTLVHLFAAEQRYVAALTGQPSPTPFSESQGFPGFDALRHSAQYTGETLIQVAQTIAYDEFRRGEYKGESFEIPAAVFLIQAIHHAMEHRSHIVTILSQRGVELPRIDGWMFEDEIRAVLAQGDAE